MATERFEGHGRAAVLNNRMNEHGEFVVRLFVKGRHQAGAEYFTNDIEDARATAAHMAGIAPNDEVEPFYNAEKKAWGRP